MPAGRSIPLGARAAGTIISRTPPAFMPLTPSSTPSHSTFSNGLLPYRNAMGLSLAVSNRTLSPMDTLALMPTTLPASGALPELLTRISLYLRPLAVSITSPLPATGPLSVNDLRISLPSVEASNATSARPPASPKRREMKEVALRTGSNWLKPAPCLLCSLTLPLRSNFDGVAGAAPAPALSCPSAVSTSATSSSAIVIARTLLVRERVGTWS
mmetsp:Transcript_39895/g.79840  ORF Transcript_39895/g.79840 Transcript_39895/m.79840 type:complete len:214 (+) Transcript_39895:677-1318(+)